ncbi:zincin-like metallopeptidase domain-containing protein [Bradyrhizobium yuanmingense]|uniref:zincin-like metallopeptidase domain-containing protein n=1 Tax=Bradyrhizobium yuanmingense TaxID=108015 RepID=UPI0023B9A4E9|nr:zincin-like metallopeptidase domain-containing protein [Bradyrhizobium yuanmingense]MDF0582065.1 zincin-like metallopeptidase domain-containing protein [Bradyrhizobium yuanmingense]
MKTTYRNESRLNREFGRQRFGDEGYAIEEVAAELGAAFLSADLSLPPEVRRDHASYIAFSAEERTRDLRDLAQCPRDGGLPAWFQARNSVAA